MKGKRLLALSIGWGLLCCLPHVSIAGEVKAMRGTASIPEISPAPDQAKVPARQKTMKRLFIEQPPMIPHEVDDYTVSATQNDCLDCHTREKTSEAPAIGASHYRDAAGRELQELAATRHFCLLCHAPQTDAKPPVDNTFVPAEENKP